MTVRQAKYLGGNHQKPECLWNAPNVHYFQQNRPLRRSLKLDAFQRISSGEPTAQCPSHVIRATPALFKYQMKCCTMGLLWRDQTKFTPLFLVFFFFFSFWRACFYILNPLYLLNLPNLHRLPNPPPPAHPGGGRRALPTAAPAPLEHIPERHPSLAMTHHLQQIPKKSRRQNCPQPARNCSSSPALDCFLSHKRFPLLYCPLLFCSFCSLKSIYE